MIQVFIIEDEIKTARYIASLVQETEGFSVAGVAGSVKSAVAWLQTNAVPQLIISDIKLGDGTGFDVIKLSGVKVPVIFCTAYNQYAINAFEVNGIDYLLKPVDQQKLRLALQKFLDMKLLFHPNGSYPQRLQTAMESINKTHKTTLLIHHRERIIPLKLSEVVYIQSENGILTLHTLSSRYHATHTLEEMEQMADPDLFFQANRQVIVNKKFIGSVEHYFSRRLMVHISDAAHTEIIVSKARVQQFLAWLKQ